MTFIRARAAKASLTEACLSLGSAAAKLKAAEGSAAAEGKGGKGTTAAEIDDTEEGMLL